MPLKSRTEEFQRVASEAVSETAQKVEFSKFLLSSDRNGNDLDLGFTPQDVSTETLVDNISFRK